MTSTITPIPRVRSVVLVTPDVDLRHRLGQRLASMRWHVLPASGGAEAMFHLDELTPEAIIIDHWLPDLNAAEFTAHAAALCPSADVMAMDGSASGSGSKSSRRHELLHALREAQEDASPGPDSTAAVTAAPLSTFRADRVAQWDGAAWSSAPVIVPRSEVPVRAIPQVLPFSASDDQPPTAHASLAPMVVAPLVVAPAEIRMHLPDMVGDSPGMRELAAMVRMVAPHSTPVLIQGETGTGKELVAKAVHRLSSRASKPFVVLNCAAIPEQLLEAELFGHTRGAFTGAVTSRTGRIEAAHGGTLFLDEIGEMPLPLQAKLLRFVENGEIQRVGDNDTSRVDVRIIAATHQPLEANAEAKLFRLDLYHRLAVFPLDVPTLRSRPEDIPMLAEHLLRKLGANAPRRAIEPDALAILCERPWFGNVRELSHALHRAAILTGDAAAIGVQHLRLRGTMPAS